MPAASARPAQPAASAALVFEDLSGLFALVAPPLPAQEEDDGDEPSAPAAEGDGEGNALRLRDHIAALPVREHEDFWRKVLQVAGEHLSGESPAVQGSTEDAAPSEENVPDAHELRAQTIGVVALLLATFADVALNAVKNPALPPAFAEALALCQELLLSIPDGPTQALIAQALEKVCTSNFEGREDYYGGCLMYLIGKCLSPKSTSADVTRLHRVRHLLSELDWEHESIESLKLQLMRCVASPTFVRSTHGPELVAVCFAIHPGFVGEVHSTIKNQVIYSRAGVMKGYANALFKAWRASEGGTRIQLEQCIQEWVLLAVRTARKSADRARSMLEELHRHRHEDRLNELMCRLYGPVLWRSLKVANWQVRENAARLLQYTFPLIPNDLGVAEKEQELIRQLRLLRETLEDPSEPVRRVGVSAVCVTLKNYWELMPPSEICELLTVLMNKNSKDKRAPMVRATVAQGFGWILQNPMSHPTMSAVLPQTADLLHDRAPLVRAAFVELLMVVTKCKGVSVGSIAPTDQLLLRLASEHTEGQAERLQRGLTAKKTGSAMEVKASPDLVAKQLAKLIAPSLFNQDLVQQVARCHHFMQNAPLALLALLTHLHDVVPIEDRVKLAAALFKYGLREAAVLVDKPSHQQPKMAATMLRVVGVLLEGAFAEVPKQKKSKKAAAVAKLPKDLESFLYQNVSEEDFLHLLKASHEDEGAAATQLREDLLFALAPLDPARLPRTAQLVQHELVLACRGGESSLSLPQLAAMLRIAVRWEKLGGVMEVAWERLLAAAARLGRRQSVAEDLGSALTVAEVAFRDPDVRGAVLRAEAPQLKQVVEAFCKAFCTAWSKGIAEVRSPTKAGDVRLLGPAAERWPRVLGFVVRQVLHLEHRVGAPAAVAAGGKDEATSTYGGLSARVLEQLSTALTSEPTIEALEALEVVASSSGGRKRAKTSTGAPADMDAILQAHERLLEALNAANFLSVLRPEHRPDEKGGGDDAQEVAAAVASSHLAVDIRRLEAGAWRWAAVADRLRPGDEGPRVAQTWVFLGRMVQEMSHAGTPTPDLVAAIRALFLRVNEDTPADDDLKKVLHALLQRLEFEPQMVALVGAVVGAEGGGDEGADGSDPVFSARLAKALEEALPSFRNLRRKLRPQAAAAAAPPRASEEFGRDRRRVLASPTPQKASRGQAPAADAEAETAEEDDLAPSAPTPTESAPESDGRASVGMRSFSARSRSPPARSVYSDASLFRAVFDRVREGSLGDSGVDVD